MVEGEGATWHSSYRQSPVGRTDGRSGAMERRAKKKSIFVVEGNIGVGEARI